MEERKENARRLRTHHARTASVLVRRDKRSSCTVLPTRLLLLRPACWRNNLTSQTLSTKGKAVAGRGHTDAHRPLSVLYNHVCRYPTGRNPPGGADVLDVCWCQWFWSVEPAEASGASGFGAWSLRRPALLASGSGEGRGSSSRRREMCSTANLCGAVAACVERRGRCSFV